MGNSIIVQIKKMLLAVQESLKSTIAEAFSNVTIFFSH